MAKEPAKTSGGNRRQKLAALENQQKSAQRRRSAGLLAICVVLAAALLSYPIYLVVKDSQASSAAMADLGVATDAAGCDPAATHPASGNQNHVADGTKVTYDRTPPDSGPHYARRHRSPSASTPPTTGRPWRPWCTTWSTATRWSGTATALRRRTRTRWRRSRRPSPPRTTTRTRSSSPRRGPRPTAPGSRTGKNVVLTRWTADPNNPADTTQAAGRPPALHRGQRRGHRVVHADLPVDGLPGAQRGLTPRRRATGHTSGVGRRPAGR